jgi:hypothetical protein
VDCDGHQESLRFGCDLSLNGGNILNIFAENNFPSLSRQRKKKAAATDADDEEVLSSLFEDEF